MLKPRHLRCTTGTHIHSDFDGNTLGCVLWALCSAHAHLTNEWTGRTAGSRLVTLFRIYCTIHRAGDNPIFNTSILNGSILMMQTIRRKHFNQYWILNAIMRRLRHRRWHHHQLRWILARLPFENLISLDLSWFWKRIFISGIWWFAGLLSVVRIRLAIIINKSVCNTKQTINCLLYV